MERIPQAVATILLISALSCPVCSAQTTGGAGPRLGPAVVRAQREIEDLLNEFLSHVADPAMHERFWADDLVYTGASGAVRTKQEIVKSVREEAAQKKPDTTTYSAEHVQVRQYGDVAVLNFQLVAREGDKVETYRNSGTFVQRNGKWQAVNWQATKVGPPKP